MQAETQAVAEVEAESFHLAGEPDLGCFRECTRDFVRAHSRLQQCDGAVHPFTRVAVRAYLRRRRAADVEGAVVAGAIAHERLDDVEEGLVSGADQSIGEIVRMWTAALAGDGIDRLDAIGTHVVQAAGRECDDLALPDSRLERFGNVLIDTVDHRRSHVEQGELIDVLDLAR